MRLVISCFSRGGDKTQLKIAVTNDWIPFVEIKVKCNEVSVEG